MKVVLQTDRVTLRQFIDGDAYNLFSLDHDRDVLKYASENPLPDVGSYGKVIRDVYLALYEKYENYGFWAAELRPSATFIGWFCLHPAAEAGEAAGLLEFEDDEVEVGYRLRRSAWGKNYATEVTRALVAWAFQELGVRRIVATTSSENLASIRVLEKAALKRVDRLYRLPWSDVPFVKYVLCRDAWASAISGDDRAIPLLNEP